jgi:hypothetical protein
VYFISGRLQQRDFFQESSWVFRQCF